MNRVPDSEYQFNSPFSLSKRIVSFLIDSLLLLVAVILCFQLVDVLYVNFNGRLNEINGEISESRRLVVECFTGSGLMQYDESDGTALEDELMGQNFIYSLVLSTLGEDVSDKAAYEGDYIFGDMGETDRSVVYYYAQFKPAHSEEYTDYDAAKSGKAYVEELFFSACNNEENGYFGESFPLLDRNVAAALDRLIVGREDSCEINGVTYYGRDIFVELYNAFSVILSDARTEFSGSYRPYTELNRSFSDSRDQLIKIKTGELCIAYFMGAFVCFMIVPLIFKGNSAAFLLLRGRCIERSGLKMRWYNYILRWICRSLLYFSNILFVILLTYGRYAAFFLGGSIAGGLKFYMLCLIPIVVMLVSFVMFVIDKSDRRTLTDRLSLTAVKEKE